MTAVEVIQIVIPACSMVVAAIGLVGIILERRSSRDEDKAVMSSKLDQLADLNTELKEMVSRLLDGYNSNDKRISLLEDRYKNLSNRVGNLERESKK